jgi:Putative metal-binding motif
MPALIVSLMLLSATDALAYSTGKTGSSTGCGTCHGTAASSSVTSAFSVASTTVVPGDALSITFTVASSDSTHLGAGLNVAATGGTLAAGTDTKLSSGQITHDGVTALAGGSAAFTMSWTAPSTEGTYTVAGAGNAVNSNGASTGDGWAVATSLTLVVDDGCDDLDGDTVTDCDGDCDDSDVAVYPGADESCNGADDDCDDETDEADAIDASTWYADTDGDGYGAFGETAPGCSAPSGYVADSTDCDDTLGDVYPGATEVWYDGIDQDCDGSDDDQDGDGYVLADDCDDTRADVYPGAKDAWYDGLDANCGGDSDYDADADGVDSSSYDGEDCDDADGTVYPGATDAAYDGIDSDCEGDSDYDADSDGSVSQDYGGDDCDDSRSDTYPGATEIWYDGVDQNCDGNDDDHDADGWPLAEDCDDLDNTVNPGMPEVWYDGIDQNCDDNDSDQDMDGYVLDKDCDDLDPTVWDDCGGADSGDSGGDGGADGGADGGTADTGPSGDGGTATDSGGDSGLAVEGSYKGGSCRSGGSSAVVLLGLGLLGGLLRGRRRR